jgi:hypothetical protein
MSKLVEKVDWVDVISKIGFPIVVCIALGIACKVYWLDPSMKQEEEADEDIKILLNTFSDIAETNGQLIKNTNELVIDVKEDIRKNTQAIDELKLDVKKIMQE